MGWARTGAWRRWAALFFLAIGYWLAMPATRLVYGAIARPFDLHMIVNGEMVLPPYAVLMALRLIVDVAIVAGLLAILKVTPARSPVNSRFGARRVTLGFVTGFLVMAMAILAIAGTGSATITAASQSITQAAAHALGWLPFDFLGATGEELFGRVAVLLVAERFVGKWGAMLVSAALFSFNHLGNPGASPIWLFRLSVQGLLLSYAVYRTGSVWWSAGYHTGWNWVCAAIFGAAGSGYLNHGHLLDFSPIGAPLVTGGTIGPEGSLFAFPAMLIAFLLLRWWTTAGRELTLQNKDNLNKMSN